MATTAPTPASAAKPSVPAPAVVAAPVAPAAPDPATEIAQLKARLAQLEPASDDENKPTGPETLNMGGLVLRKTVGTDGVCETEVLKKPMIDRELIRATKAVQRESGF
jgi:hypothetical protein